MKIYHVTEYVTDEKIINAEGVYSSLEEAQTAILSRVSEVYTKDEMKNYHFFNDGFSYETEENSGCEKCFYEINTWTLNERIN